MKACCHQALGPQEILLASAVHLLVWIVVSCAADLAPEKMPSKSDHNDKKKPSLSEDVCAPTNARIPFRTSASNESVRVLL